MAALRAKEFGLDVSLVFQFEDLSDPFVLYLLAQKDAEKLELPEEFAEIKNLLASCGKDPLAQHKVLTEWKFAEMFKMSAESPFSIDPTIAYTISLLLVEDWIALDEQLGKEALKTCME